jgi:RNA polymerase sigma-70 factor (sigma-E family)
VGTSVDDTSSASGTFDAPADEFREFFERHHTELARLAALLTGDPDAADDLAADALVTVWHQWDRVRAADHPAAYARGVVANLARTRLRSLIRERRRVALFWSRAADPADGPDLPAVLDVRDALRRLPFRKRACVVLRHAFDLSEKETAVTLGISVGTVKSQTSRGIAELESLLGAERAGAVRSLDAPSGPRRPTRGDAKDSATATPAAATTHAGRRG